MANEISINFQFKCNNPSGSTTGFVANETFTKLFNQTALGANGQIVNVPTSATTYTFSNITTPGFMFLQNLDSTNYVEWGIQGGGVFYPVGKLQAGEMAFFRMDTGITYQMKANTAAVNVNYLLLND